MRVFFPQIVKALPSTSDTQDRRWIYVPYDRLTDRTGPLLDTNPTQCGIVMVESLEKGMRRPYHKKKLALLLSNERHFALEQAARGVKVIYVFTGESFGDGLLQAQENYRIKQITLMRPAERELRLDLDQARKRGLRLEEVEDSTWLTRDVDFDQVFGLKQGTRPQNFLMDRFYRAMRKRTGLLMENGQPVGGKFSYDQENRKPYRGQVPVPKRPTLCSRRPDNRGPGTGDQTVSRATSAHSRVLTSRSRPGIAVRIGSSLSNICCPTSDPGRMPWSAASRTCFTAKSPR